MKIQTRKYRSGPSGRSKSRAERRQAGYVPVEVDLRPEVAQALDRLIERGYSAAGRSGRAGAIEQAILDADAHRGGQ